MLATLFDGVARHNPEGITFKRRAEEVEREQAVSERDLGTWNWTEDRPIDPVVPGAEPPAAGKPSWR